jgi:transcriptional regulator with XRE-family HTH domain
MKFSEVFERHLVENKINKSQLAEHIGVVSTNVYKYIDGTVVPPAEKLRKISDFLNLDLDQRINLAKSALKSNLTDKNKQITDLLNDLVTTKGHAIAKEYIVDKFGLDKFEDALDNDELVNCFKDVGQMDEYRKNAMIKLIKSILNLTIGRLEMIQMMAMKTTN